MDKHFITEDIFEELNFGEGQKNIYSVKESTEIIKYTNGDLLMAANSYGKGRTVYIAGLPYSIQNTRILTRACYYAANKESEMKRWYSDNPYCEVSAYLESNRYAVINNSNEKQTSNIYDGEGKLIVMELDPAEIKWIDIK